ncbi:hypothetical protein T439DRAFT_328196 [Meredithblackwellia eburnea MCA 4105]
MVITALATIIVKPESADEVKGKLAEFAASYRKDEGTLSWFVNQDPKNPGKFVLVERYENEAALTVHRANPTFKGFFPFLKPHLAGKIEVVPFNEVPVSVPNRDSRL